MPKVRWTGAHPVEVKTDPSLARGTVVQPGEEFEVGEEIAADLCREGRGFVPAEEDAKGGRRSAAPKEE